MSIATLAEAREYLNFGADTSHDTELQRFIDAADPVIEDLVNTVTAADYDEWHDGGRQTIVLRHRPVITLTTLTEYAGATGTVLTVAATPDVAGANSYMLDADAGILYRATSYGPSWFTAGTSNVRVQYSAGRAVIPGNIKLAALELIRHLYQSTQQSGRPAFGGAAEDQPWAPATFAIPTRVRELLGPDFREPRIA